MVKVENGRVTLEGKVEWNYQKKAVNHLVGVKMVINSITVQSRTQDAIEKTAIEHSLDRSWAEDSENIVVDVKGNGVKLTGTVDSLYEKDEASRLAWNSPGVWTVDNELFVDYDN